MDEIHGYLWREAGVERPRGLLEGVPSHMGHFEISRGEPDDAAAKNSKAFDAGRFLAGLEEKLVAEANAEIRLASGGPLANGFPKPGGAEVFGAMREGANSRNDDGVEAGHFGGRCDQAGRGTRGFECLADTAQIAAAVVDDAENR
jgi:hypothetical protein